MTDKNLKDLLRNEHTAALKDFLEKTYDTDVCQTAAGTLMIPVLDVEGNERWMKFSVIVPNASDDDGTDGYALAEEYKLKLDAAAERKAKAAEKAAKAKAKRSSKKTTEEEG